MKYLFSYILFLSVTEILAADPYTFKKITDNIYFFQSGDPVKDVVNGNSVLIVGKNESLIFDSGTSLREASWLVEQIKKLTNKPVRYVVNSHWHWDHWFGNQVFAEQYPGCRIIASASTRSAMEFQYPKFIKQAIATQEEVIITYNKEWESGVKESGEQLTAYEKTRWKETYEDLVKDSAETRLITATLPNLTFDKNMTLFLDSLEIQLMYLGHANTRGDIVLYLPKEKILVTGDILVHPIPYAFGVSPKSWIGVLKKIGAMDTKLIIPGHGDVQTDKVYLNNVLDLFESSYEQVAEGRRAGLTASEAVAKVNLEKFRLLFCGSDDARNWAFTNYYQKPMLDRIYKELGGELGE